MKKNKFYLKHNSFNEVKRPTFHYQLACVYHCPVSTSVSHPVTTTCLHICLSSCHHYLSPPLSLILSPLPVSTSVSRRIGHADSGNIQSHGYSVRPGDIADDRQRGYGGVCNDSLLRGMSSTAGLHSAAGSISFIFLLVLFVMKIRACPMACTVGKPQVLVLICISPRRQADHGQGWNERWVTMNSVWNFALLHI